MWELNCAFPLKKVLMPKLWWRRFRLTAAFSKRLPAPRLILPLYPFTLLSFSMILIIPPVPCASYFAPGLVIASILFIWLAGIDAKASAKLFPNMLEGFPLIKNRMLEFPCNSTLPSISTVTWGTFFKTSNATPPCDVISLAAL